MGEHQEQIRTLQAQLVDKEQIQADLLDRNRQLHELQEQVDTREAEVVQCFTDLADARTTKDQMAVDLDLACQAITQRDNMMIGYHNAAVQHGIDMTERAQELVQRDNENIILRTMIRESGLEYIVLPDF